MLPTSLVLNLKIVVKKFAISVRRKLRPAGERIGLRPPSKKATKLESRSVDSLSSALSAVLRTPRILKVEKPEK